VDQVALYLNRYWEQKKDLAPGSETPEMIKLLQHLQSPPAPSLASVSVSASSGDSLCCGFSACGAGAGGFLVCILRRGATIADLRGRVSRYCQQAGAGHVSLSVHEIAVDEEGIRVRDE
jgi:hypothetical protein